VLANTVPGCGVSFMENKWQWHGKVPNGEELKLAMEELKEK
jgi:transketolase